MRSRLALLIFACLLLLTNCAPSGTGGGGSGANSGGNTNPFEREDTRGENSSSSSSGSITGATIRYRYPNVPTKAGALQYYSTVFASTRLGQGGINPKETQKTLSGNKPAEQIKIEPSNASNGEHYCFSNDQHKGGPACALAATEISDHIRQHQINPVGLHPVFISALQFSFRNAPKSAGGFYSQVEFDGAYVEKAPLVTIKETGELAAVKQQHLMILGYGNAGNTCRIEQPNAVGFDPPSYMNREFYLSGIWTFDRSGRRVFANEVASEDPPQEGHWCETEGVGEYLCSVFADKVKVWHAVLMPIFYTNGKVSHRVFPSQTVVNRRVINEPGVAVTTYGKYATDTNLNFVSVPTGASANAVIGKTDNSGNVIPNWEKYYIRKLCLTGRRIDKDPYGGPDIVTPLIHAMRAELRSPYVLRVE